MIRHWPTVSALASLGDALRHRLYTYIRNQGHPVTRDEAAAAVGISRNLAAFHLDKLVDAGLLAARYAAPEGVPRGPGRAPKVYEPAEVEIRVSIPERNYELLGEILLDTVAAQGSDEAAFRIARENGFARGRAENVRQRLGRMGPERALTVTQELLTEDGFEPHRTNGQTVRLRNCPFRTLAARNTPLVCGINRAYLDGFLRGLGNDTVAAELTPQPGACCVTLRAPQGG